MAYIGNAPAAGIVNSGNILDGSINTADLADAAVTAAKIADAAVSAAKMASGAARQNFGAGAVLQVVSVVNGSQTAVSNVAASATYDYVSASITPSSANSKILIVSSVQTWWQHSASAILYGNIRILRNGSLIHSGASAENVIGPIVEYGFRHSLCRLDSPGSTSSLTYTINYEHNSPPSLTSLVINRSSSPALLTLMEIAG